MQPLVARSDFVDQHGMRDDDPLFLQLAVVQRQHQAIVAGTGQQFELGDLPLLVDVSAHDGGAALDFHVAGSGEPETRGWRGGNLKRKRALRGRGFQRGQNFELQLVSPGASYKQYGHCGISEGQGGRLAVERC